MRNNRLLILIFVFHLHTLLYAQNITGVIQDNYGFLVSNAAIVVKDANEKVIHYTFTNNKGVYKLPLNENMNPFIIVVKKYGFEEQFQKFDLNNTVYNFVIEKVITLAAVELIKKSPNIRVDKDTTFYKIENFIDGTERKVEDILRKLPGITISEKGEIQFKGRKIETVLLDGDDFFKSNYTLGTKNIAANMLERVEAIERYSSNQVLRDLEFSDKVVVNLKLKKGEQDFSKSATVGLGIKEKYYYNLNGILISYKLKSIITSSFNNIGINETPYDFLNNFYFENPKEFELYLTKKINLPIAHFGLNNNYIHQNRNFLNAINNIFKIDKTATLSVNLSHTIDRLKINNSQIDIFNINDQPIINEQINSIIKKPEIWSASFSYLKNYKNTRIEIDWNFKNWNSNEQLSNTNNGLFEPSLLSSDEDLAYLKGSFSTKLNKNSALDFSSLVSFYDSNENLYFKNTKPFNHFNVAAQNVVSNKKIIENKLLLIGKIRSFKYKFGIYQRYDSELLHSKIVPKDSLTFENEVQNNNLKWGLLTNLSYQKNKLLISNENIIFINKNREEKKNTIKINPRFNALYTISNKSSVALEFSLISTDMTVNNLYTNYIFTDNRSLTKNISAFDMVDYQSINMKYTHHNFIKDFIVDLNVKFNFNNINWINDFSFNNNLYFNTLYLEKSPNYNTEFNVSFKKMMPALLSKIQLSSRLNTYNYQSKFFDIINENRLIQSQNELGYLSVFSGFFNFSNKLKFTSNSFKNSLENEFTIVLKKGKNHTVKINNSLLIPNTHSYKDKIMLINLEYFYFHKGKILSFAINNLTNSPNMNINSINEYSTSYFSQDILPIGFLVKYSF